MSANIFGDRFLVIDSRKPAWWDIAGSFVADRPMGAVEATKAAKCDYNVITLPRVVNLPNGDTLRSDSSVDIVREPLGAEDGYQLLGTASKDFALLQNIELAEAIEKLTERWPVETVGALGNGEKFFLCLRAGFTTIAGDEVRRYVCLHDTKLPGETLKLLYTPVRTECQNTFIAGQMQARSLTHIQHREGMRLDLDLAIDLMSEVEAQMAQQDDKLRVMVKGSLVAKQVERILASVYVEPKPSRKASLLAELAGTVELRAEQRETLEKAASKHDSKVLATAAYREGAKFAFEKFNDEHPDVARTPWALYNAITETEDHRRGNLANGSALFGWRAQVKARAFESCYAAASKLAAKAALN